MKGPGGSGLRGGQYLASIYAYGKVLGRLTAEADLRRHFGTAPPTVHRMVMELEARGLTHRTPGRARSIELRVRPEDLPILR